MRWVLRTEPPAPLPTCRTISYADALAGYSFVPLPVRPRMSRRLLRHRSPSRCPGAR